MKIVFSVSRWFVALATPKSITFGTGLPSATVTRTFDGLTSRWITPFWWACWMAAHTWRNRASRPRVEQLMPVAVIGDRYAGDVLHRKERSAVAGHPCVEDHRDIRMVHHRQRLALRFESGHHLTRVHPGFDDLDGNASVAASAARPDTPLPFRLRRAGSGCDRDRLSLEGCRRGHPRGPSTLRLDRAAQRNVAARPDRQPRRGARHSLDRDRSAAQHSAFHNAGTKM